MNKLDRLTKEIEAARKVAMRTNNAIVAVCQIPQSIFAVIAFSKPTPKTLKYQRAFGYFFTLEEAAKAVKENRCDIFEELHELVAIEEINPGIHGKGKILACYKWEYDKKNPKNGEFSNGKYIPCQIPEKH